jgi:hypothetical protein
VTIPQILSVHDIPEEVHNPAGVLKEMANSSIKARFHFVVEARIIGGELCLCRHEVHETEIVCILPKAQHNLQVPILAEAERRDVAFEHLKA